MNTDRILLERQKVKVNGTDIEAVIIEQDIDRPLALVDFETVKRLASLLPTANFEQIKDNLLSSIRRTHKLEDMMKVLSDELAFHNSVNIITKAELTPRPPAFNLTKGLNV